MNEQIISKINESTSLFEKTLTKKRNSIRFLYKKMFNLVKSDLVNLILHFFYKNQEFK